MFYRTLVHDLAGLLNNPALITFSKHKDFNILLEGMYIFRANTSMCSTSINIEYQVNKVT